MHDGDELCVTDNAMCSGMNLASRGVSGERTSGTVQVTARLRA